MPDRQTVYLHGFPGGPEELQAFGMFTFDGYAPDRRHDAENLDFSAYVDHLAGAIDTKFPYGRMTLIGFSAGARMALELGAKLSARVDEIILVSAAAPLQSGDFLKHMAGRLVFGTALRSPTAFRTLTWVQAQAARWAPARLFQSILASALGADRALKHNPQFARVIQSVVTGTLQAGAVGYRREVLAYVRPWGDLLARVTAPVTLYHGTMDNWTPMGMADVLAAHLPNVRAVHRLPGSRII